MMTRKIKNLGTTVCSEEYGVTHLVGGNRGPQHQPCAQCPFRRDVPTGVFPAEAFRVSASTAYDAAFNTFACHMAGAKQPTTCAGFLLTHGNNNIGVRLAKGAGRISMDEVSDGDFSLYPTYREMAIANGVDPADPVLTPIRGNDE